MAAERRGASIARPEVTVYTRPGCPYCFLLRRGLRRYGVPFTEVDIWRDPPAAAAVRAVADGNETVPTVEVGGRWLVNPRARRIRDLVPSSGGRGGVDSALEQTGARPGEAGEERPQSWRGIEDRRR
ncbi:glutaredoxin domain-containing protein [Micromonospora sp. NPDC049679]|uniref:glutaredoxin family protein n=1 Tax=Micromonospora sp. NPDC049679 TaxID=3155920 RepID=UPI0034045CD1